MKIPFKTNLNFLSFLISVIALSLSVFSFIDNRSINNRTIELEQRNDLNSAFDLLGLKQPGYGLESFGFERVDGEEDRRKIVLAIRHLDKVLIRDPENHLANRLYAISKYKIGAFVAAIKKQYSTVEQYPTSSIDYIVLGEIYKGAMMEPEASWAFYQAIKYNNFIKGSAGPHSNYRLELASEFNKKHLANPDYIKELNLKGNGLLNK